MFNFLQTRASRSKKLLDAARTGDKQRIERLIDAGVEAWAIQKSLVAAAEAGSRVGFTTLLERGADPYQEVAGRPVFLLHESAWKAVAAWAKAKDAYPRPEALDPTSQQVWQWLEQHVAAPVFHSSWSEVKEGSEFQVVRHFTKRPGERETCDDDFQWTVSSPVPIDGRLTWFIQPDSVERKAYPRIRKLKLPADTYHEVACSKDECTYRYGYSLYWDGDWQGERAVSSRQNVSQWYVTRFSVVPR